MNLTSRHRENRRDCVKACTRYVQLYSLLLTSETSTFESELVKRDVEV